MNLLKNNVLNVEKLKNIKFFGKQIKKQKIITFRNKCNTCRKNDLLFEVKNNPDRRKVYLEYGKKEEVWIM